MASSSAATGSPVNPGRVTVANAQHHPRRSSPATALTSPPTTNGGRSARRAACSWGYAFRNLDIAIHRHLKCGPCERPGLFQMPRIATQTRRTSADRPQNNDALARKWPRRRRETERKSTTSCKIPPAAHEDFATTEFGLSLTSQIGW